MASSSSIAATMASSRFLAAAFVAALVFSPAHAGRIADIRNTPHNLSATSPGSVKATTETQVCVFCHTPHGATQGATPLWNRQLSGQTYTPYTSSSLDANAIQGSLDHPAAARSCACRATTARSRSAT